MLREQRHILLNKVHEVQKSRALHERQPLCLLLLDSSSALFNRISVVLQSAKVEFDKLANEKVAMKGSALEPAADDTR